ncbi:MAG: diacylglycerol kinase family lipid kinase, partial [Firmicutes bacterium]|nr:diacylglycerol kinase family lipid kinase [Bacillota bacterium]
MTYKVIANPTAGRGLTRNNLPNIEKELEKLGIDYKLYLTKAPGHASDLAADLDDFNGIIAVGGDGTINEIVNGMPKDNKPLCIVPLGTGNDLARSLKIPFGIESLKLLTEGQLSQIDLGLNSEGIFLCSVAVGLATDVMIRVNSKRSRRILKGPLAILFALIASVFQLKPLNLIIDADDYHREITSVLVYVMNTPYTGGGIYLAPEADPSDGFFDVVLVKDATGWEIMKILPKIYTGGHVNHPKVEFLRAKNVQIKSNLASEIMVDGEIKGKTPLKTT